MIKLLTAARRLWSERPLSLLAACAIAAALLIVGVRGLKRLAAPKIEAPGAAMESATPPTAPAAAPARRDLAAFVGDWHWIGLECGKGPHVVADANGLTITMDGDHTYKHTIERVEGDTIYTIVTAPESWRGQEYEITRRGAKLHLKPKTGPLDEWTACAERP